MGDEDVWSAVVVPVADGDPHRAAVIGNPGLARDILEFSVVEVQEQLAPPQVIGHVEVRPAVPVEVVPGG